MLIRQPNSERFGRALSVFAAFFFFASGDEVMANECAVGDAVGRIEVLERSRETDVQVERSSGETRNAQAYQYLCIGDTIRSSGSGAIVGVRWDGDMTTQYITTPEFTVQAERTNSLSSIAKNWLARFGFLSAGSRVKTATATAARTLLEDDNRDGKPTDGLRIGIERRQFVASDRDAIAMIWSGEAHSIRISIPGDELNQNFSVQDQSFLVIPFPEHAESIFVELTGAKGSADTIEIKRSDSLPSPPIPESLELRQDELALAFWLALEAGPSWRLEGLSRLHEMSGSNLAADHVWAEIVSGSKARD